MPKAQTPANQIWVCYNAWPNGQVCADHFEDEVLTERGPKGEREVKFTARERMESWKRQPNVALNLNGKLMRHECLVYDGPPLWGNPKAGDVVIEWGIGKGVQPIVTSKGKEPFPYEHTKRIESLEARVGESEAKLDRILEILEKKEDQKKQEKQKKDLAVA